MATDKGTMFPGLRYTDVKTAVDWLCTVLGFERRLVVPGPEGKIVHAQLQLGTGIIMLGPDDVKNEFGVHVKPPKLMGGMNSQAPYIYIDDIDKHYHDAKEAGAEILVELREEPYGGKFYLCRDLEGHIWSFGSYDPLTD
ncbi:MAG: glyoxalase [Saprospiraceae bacterium]|nr:glyoxalase [Saprospiraceae bacterium]